MFCLVAIVGAAIAIPAFWVNSNLVDRDGFSDMVSPLADNPKVQEHIADEITVQVSAAAPLIPEALIRPLAGAYTRGDNFKADFTEAMNQQHDWLFEEASPEDEGQVMSLDLTPMVNRIIDDRIFGGIEISGPIEVPLTDSAAAGLEAGRYHDLGDQIGYIAYGSLVIAVVAALGGLAVARRRGLVLAAVGFGVIFGGVLTWLMGDFAQRRALDEVSGADGSAREVAELIIDEVVDSMQKIGLIAAFAGVALAVAGGLVTVMLERRR